MINPQIETKIKTKLAEIEKEHNVEILYAIESGSRAWGFESLDSDYDVRFIYKNEVNWYLTVLPRRDVIEIPIEDLMDYSGWDLRKSFFLMNKSNPVLFEWLKSPIVYKKNEKFYEIITEIAKEYFSPIATIYHYLHMASRNYKEIPNLGIFHAGYVSTWEEQKPTFESEYNTYGMVECSRYNPFFMEQTDNPDFILRVAKQITLP